MDVSKYTSPDHCLVELIPWNDAYRNGQPVVSDAVYDQLWDKLEELVEASEQFGGGGDPEVMRGRAFLNQIGAPVPAKSPWEKRAHQAPMLSLNKARNPDEFKAWGAKHKGQQSAVSPRFVVSDKCDGISLRVHYLDGKMFMALTRGDEDPQTGKQMGEDITRNVLKMQGVKGFIKGFSGWIRAEIVLTKADWKRYFPEYTNARNGAGGKAKDQKGDRTEHLTVLHYEIHRDNSGPIPTKRAQYKIMEALGLATPNWYECNTVAEIIALYEEYVAGKREALAYDIDGLVVEFNDANVMERMGVHGRGPDGAVAIKFPSDRADTPLQDIVWQVGGTGRITPVAIFTSVLLAGANVSRASMHNLDLMADMLRPSKRDAFAKGDTILVTRRGDVIPQVEALTKPLAKPSDAEWLRSPTKCPSCGSKLKRDGKFLLCVHEECPAQYAGSMSRWVKKLGIKEWGDSIIIAIYDAGMAKDPADLYSLDVAKVAALEMESGSKIGRRADIAIKNLRAQMNMPLHVFVGALGIPLMARSMCQKLVEAGYDTLGKMQNATVAELGSIPGMGTRKAKSFVGGMVKHRDVLDRLLKAGITIKAPNNGPLKGINFCLTGVRDAALQERIEENGGIVKGGVGKSTRFLICKDPNGTSGKLKKARGYGTMLLSLEDAWDLVGGR